MHQLLLLLLLLLLFLLLLVTALFLVVMEGGVLLVRAVRLIAVGQALDDGLEYLLNPLEQVLIYFSDRQCLTYHKAVSKFAYFVDWCYHDTVPERLPAEWVRVVESHLRLWKAVRLHIKEHGVQPPMRTIKAAALCMYDIGKCGVDVSTWMLNNLFRNPKHKYVQHDSKLRLRRIVCVIHCIAHVCSRVCTIYGIAIGSPRSRKLSTDVSRWWR